ncbi:carbohydrate kinase [Brachybacterium ginsengisoli]|uniref:Carbohydrate kinase n=1 Tax=Brachybacterium ginsengisoli TaxID=1331682 RepID=A0A291GWT2_9MICO|nr:carbohydrate kinase [Brachybacterium ginsengisoli]ATG54663.1 carbohydrate kinase [Brachybacterium ginsengisoli]
MSAAEALVVGEVLIDVVHAADGSVTSRPGGSPANVAVGLARLGVRTELLTTLGPDRHGDALRAHLGDAAVGLRAPTAPPPAVTSTARAVLDGRGAAEYTFDLDWDPGAFHSGDVRLLHTGSIAMMVEPGASQVEAAFAAASPGTVLSVDPNVRPSLGLAPGEVRDRIERIAPHAHVLKLSDEDLAWVHPDLGIDQALDRLHDAGATLVVLTRGAGGCTLSTAVARGDLAAPPATVVDTIGAGDSFMAGLLWAILESDGARELLDRAPTWPRLETWARTAMRCAAITVGRAGAQPPWAAELAATDHDGTTSSVPEAISTTAVQPGPLKARRGSE